jgi:sigma-B regulation protein RsbU (phosphoserine phosphatase)
MAATQAVIRSEVPQFAGQRPYPCGNLVTTVNKLICASSDPGNFVTLFFAVLDTDAKTLSFVNAGHNDPILLSGNGSSEQLHTGGLLLGAFPDVPYEESSIQLHSGQKLVIFTDGVTEAEDSEQQMYGEERLGRLLGTHRQESAEKLVSAIIADVTEFTGGNTQSDDITLLVAGVR